MHQEIPAHRHAHDRPGKRDGHVVKRLEAGKQQLGFVFRFGIDARHVFSSLNDQFHDHEGESITSADNEPLIQSRREIGTYPRPAKRGEGKDAVAVASSQFCGAMDGGANADIGRAATEIRQRASLSPRGEKATGGGNPRRDA
jgi:hypothetical protein